MFQAHIIFSKFMAACNGSTVYFNSFQSQVFLMVYRFSVIRHTESISIFQNASSCTISAEINNRKSCHQDAIFELKIHQNAFAATPLGELTALPSPPSCRWGVGSLPPLLQCRP